MAVGVVRANRNNGVLRVHFVQEPVAGGGGTAVVADLQHIGFHIHSKVQHIGLSFLFHVPGEEEGGGAEFHFHNDRSVVGVRIALHRA